MPWLLLGQQFVSPKPGIMLKTLGIAANRGAGGEPEGEGGYQAHPTPGNFKEMTKLSKGNSHFGQ